MRGIHAYYIGHRSRAILNLASHIFLALSSFPPGHFLCQKHKVRYLTTATNIPKHKGKESETELLQGFVPQDGNFFLFFFFESLYIFF